MSKKSEKYLMNLIGLDIGTTSICGVLYSKTLHKSMKVSTRKNELLNCSAGEYQQDPTTILEKVISIVDELISYSSEDIVAMSLSSQMHGVLYVDEQGDAVSPLYTWQNQMGLRLVEKQTLECYLSNILGYPVYTGYGITTHYCLYLENRIPKKAKTFCSIGDFVCMKLAANQIPITDITLANSMGICNLKTCKRAESLNKLGDDVTKYIPEISSSIKKLGFYKDIAVYQALGDNQASFIGSVKDKEESVLLNYGTSGQISFYNKYYNEYQGFELRPLGVDEGFINAAFSLCGGNSYKVLSSFFEKIVSLYTDTNEINIMKEMDNMDLDLSIKDIECMPFFLGQRGIDSNNAYFSNITEANFTPQNIVKSLVQGMANELYFYYKNLPKDKKDSINYIIGSGNGIRKNLHLQKAVELIYEKPLHLFNLHEESCLGAIIHAAKGAGIYKNYNEGSFDIVKY